MTDPFADDLSAAMKTRPVIEQAKGVLVGLRGSTPDQAFAELAHASQTHNVKLSVLAAALVDAAAGRAAREAPVKGALLTMWGHLLTRYPHRADDVGPAQVEETA